MVNSYSVDTMLRYAFEYELTNYLKIEQLKDFNNEEQQKIINYFEKRIAEIKDRKYSHYQQATPQ